MLNAFAAEVRRSREQMARSCPGSVRRPAGGTALCCLAEKCTTVEKKGAVLLLSQPELLQSLSGFLRRGPLALVVCL